MSLPATQNETKEGAFWRKFLLPEEDRLQEFQRQGYRWFRSANVVAIEHFRQPHVPAQRAGRFGWLPLGREE
jgi:hypothetical protein